MSFRCMFCKTNDADHAPRTYQDVETGKVYHGVREFCSDACEDRYIAAMEKQYPGASEWYLRLQ